MKPEKKTDVEKKGKWCWRVSNKMEGLIMFEIYKKHLRALVHNDKRRSFIRERQSYEGKYFTPL